MDQLPQLKDVNNIEEGYQNKPENNEGIPDQPNHRRRSNIQFDQPSMSSSASKTSRNCCSCECFLVFFSSAVFIAMQVTVVTMMVLSYGNFSTDDPSNKSSRDFLLADAILTSVFSFLIIIFFPLSIVYDIFKILLTFTIFAYSLAHFALGVTFIVFFFTKSGWQSQTYLYVVLVYYLIGLLKCCFSNRSDDK